MRSLAGSAADGGSTEQLPVKSGSANDATIMLSNAQSAVIVPGYGLAVARAQHALKELTDKLIEQGVQVNGYAMGGGLECVRSCDICIAE